MIALARQKPLYGYRRLHALLARRGWLVNHKRLYRLYRQEHLAVRRLRRKRLARLTAPIAQLERANQEWSMDFVMDGLATGRALRVLTVVDSYTRECPSVCRLMNLMPRPSVTSLKFDDRGDLPRAYAARLQPSTLGRRHAHVSSSPPTAQ